MYDGILPLYKPRGMTSHDAIYKLRKLLHMKRIGHTGTLDPDVDGVLPICLGRATRVAEYITNGIKAYEGTVALGTSTTTEDASGEIVSEKEVEKPIPREKVLTVLQGFLGERQQTPPMYSAVKVRGKRLYEYAREGIPVERPTRQIIIYTLQLRDEASSYMNKIPFEVVCGKGTYVRTLAVEIGEQLGYPAHLESLTRTVSGGYSLEDCYTFSDIEKAVETEKLQDLLAPIEKALQDFQKWIVSNEEESKIQNGAVLPLSEDLNFNNEPIAVYNRKGHCLALYQLHPQKEGFIKPMKVFSSAD
ncbi:tRNA pseudouridine(55) synthase TruB [Pullulanibacillus sp. KACC 23026]|uniref:tRNA pseudouridine(55) synthase TruB n=1 Tax=Pullulanibacillus sp. KACC 23026 TaxID=3028315 RepID=UPI0023B08DA4|nr:tRNA pseudouridine(55) synthase TruB [Pullulanibacillus sp. KACC 23026]WEG11578.1 tRNA pseudouridine(55) synthase TruB [Pullulanibacillus sp. KACC 23026]